MTKLDFTISCVATDRTRPIASGEIQLEGCNVRMAFGEPEEIFRTALREKAYQVTELSLASHIVTTARGDAAYVGIPVFLSRAFRHSAVFVRDDAGIESLSDLRGRKVGVPEYQQTAAMWVRGMMQDEGVAVSEVTWYVGGLNEPSAGERIALSLPENIQVHTLTGSDTLDALLLEGNIDAIISPRIPKSLQSKHPRVRQLYRDLRAAEVDYYNRTGFFPIMHCLAVRKDMAAEHPWLPAALFRGFSSAKRLTLEGMGMTNVLRVSLPLFAHDFRAAMALTHGAPWPYGFSRNRAELEAMTRYAHADGIASRLVTPEELFHPDTLALTE